MTILFSRVARLHFLLACVRISLVFTALFACALCARGFGFLHDMHSLATGSEVGDMWLEKDLENENFASPSAKQNEEAAREYLRERQERRRSLNDAWIVRIIEYYRDTKADPGGRGIRGLKEIIEERGLDAGPITQFKQAEAMLSQAYEDSDCERLPQMGEPITLEDGQVSMFIPPDIMEPEMLLACTQRG